VSKFNSKWSDTEIIAKLTELGFTSSSASTSKKTTKKQSSDITAQLKSLKKLLDDGVLSKDEFEKAKKKLLN
jgi:predicted Zn-dependent peptidase